MSRDSAETRAAGVFLDYGPMAAAQREVERPRPVERIGDVDVGAGRVGDRMCDRVADGIVALVVGNERSGLTGETLAKLDEVVEIPVWGLPYAYNVATSAALVLALAAWSFTHQEELRSFVERWS